MAMVMRIVMLVWLSLAALLSPALAQEEVERSAFIAYVENVLSTPDRQIRLNGIQGTLSSNVSFESITISDENGIWLTIEEPQLVWTRSGLLRGRLDVESLTATRINLPRLPQSDEELPGAESRSFSMPDLPVSINIETLAVETVSIGEPVVGLAAEIAVEGRIAAEESSLDTALEITRLDGPGGQLAATVVYDGSPETLALDVQLDEPANGIVANALNLAGGPPVSLTINGDGPVSNLDVVLTADVDSERILDGALNLNEIEQGLRADATLDGRLRTVVPAVYGALLSDVSRIRFDALFADSGAIRLDQFSIDSGALTVMAQARLLDDGFVEALDLRAALAQPDGQTITVGGADGAGLQLGRGLLDMAFDAATGNDIAGQLTLAGLNTGTVSIDAVDVVLDGTINTDGQKALSFALNGAGQGIDAPDEALAEAIGSRVTIEGSGQWRGGQPLQIDMFDVEGRDYALRANGRIAQMQFAGQIGLEAPDLTSFAPLLDRPLSGSAALVLDGSIAPLTGAYDLAVDGVGNGVTTGSEIADAALRGTTNLSGGVARGPEGLRFDRLRATNNQIDIVADGLYASRQADLNVNGVLRDLADLSEAGQGRIDADIRIVGEDRPFVIDADVTMPGGSLTGKPVETLNARFDGQLDDGVIGTLSVEGRLGGDAISAASEVAASDVEIAIRDLLATIGASTIEGDFVRQGDTGLMTGDLRINSNDISTLGALALMDASGALQAELALAPAADGSTQTANIAATIRDLTANQIRIGAAAIEAEIDDLLGTISIDATVDAQSVRAGGIVIRTLDATATTRGTETRFDARAALDQNSAVLSTNGVMEQATGVTTIRVDGLQLTSSITDARLTAPATITHRNGQTTISDANLAVGGGTVRLSGSTGDSVDVEAVISGLPLAIANAVQPDLGLGGTLDGTIRAQGPSSAPIVRFDATGTAVAVAALKQAGIAPVNATANGQFDPSSNTITLTALNVSNPQTVTLTGSGRIPLQGAGLQFSADGSAPLALAQQFIDGRGVQLTGLARFSVNASGLLSSPQLDGLLSIADGSVRDPLSNLQLNNVRLLAGLTGQQIVVRTLNADLSTGGSVAGQGTVGLLEGMPADLALTLANARYTDGETFATTLNGRLTLTGNLARDPLLAGRLSLAETDIVVPETFGSDEALLNVTHVQPDAATRQTLDRIALTNPLPTPGARPSVLQLDVTINAPARIFVRGRGLDAELGGSLRVRGPVTNVSPTGGFELRRGRLEILGQRIDLDEGTITLAGDLDPFLNFLARTESGDVTAFIQLRGRASDLDVSFFSEPELPEDEVLARILFDRSVSDLSPVQIARLATAAAELTGGNSPDLVGGLREGLGLDDLDVVQDDDGNAAVRAGRYISDNVYLGVEAGAETEATINLDITDDLTARGSVGTSGESELGIFFERDY